MSDTTQLLRARWVFPAAGPPIEDGVIEIDRGRIVRLGSGPEPDALDLGDVAVIPGLVNAHTHLEFSHLRQPLAPATPFADWIRAVVKARRENERGRRQAIEAGITESTGAGTTMIGEIATSPDSTVALESLLTPSVAFRELLGLDDAAIDRHLGVMETHFADAERRPHSPCLRGLSPHAPYSVHPDLFGRIVEFAQDRNAPLAMHLAETPEELELLERGTGPLVEMLRGFGLWREGVIPRGTTILSYLESLARLDRVLVIHGNYLTDEEIDFLTDRPQFSVVYCPRTHAGFRHQTHPWRLLLDRGVNVALGTDSRASNPDLSVWNEVLFLKQRADDVSGTTLLEMATTNGSRALGLHGEHGSLDVGQRATLVIIDLADSDAVGTTPHERLLHPASRVAASMHQGRWLYGGPVQ